MSTGVLEGCTSPASQQMSEFECHLVYLKVVRTSPASQQMNEFECLPVYLKVVALLLPRARPFVKARRGGRDLPNPLSKDASEMRSQKKVLFEKTEQLSSGFLFDQLNRLFESVDFRFCVTNPVH
jgi:hypothetical protein